MQSRILFCCRFRLPKLNHNRSLLVKCYVLSNLVEHKWWYAMQNIYNYVVICVLIRTHTHMFYTICWSVQRMWSETCNSYSTDEYKKQLFSTCDVTIQTSSFSSLVLPYAIGKHWLNAPRRKRRTNNKKSIYGQWFCHIEHSVLFSKKRKEKRTMRLWFNVWFCGYVVVSFK